MQHSHDHDHNDGDHYHPAAPMVDEITDFESTGNRRSRVGDRKGLVHRRRSPEVYRVGRVDWAGRGSRLVAKAWTDPAFKARVLADAVAACREIGIDWTEPTGSGTPSDYMQLRVLEDTPTLASRDRLYPVLVLSAAAARPLALLVPFAQLSSPAGPLAASCAGGVRIEPPRRGGGAGRGLQPEMPVYGPSCAAGRHRELDGGAAGGDRDPRLHDRRCLAPARQEVRRCSARP